MIKNNIKKYRLKTNQNISNINTITTNHSEIYNNLSDLELIKLCGESSGKLLWEEFYKRFNYYIQLYIKKAWKTRVSSRYLDSFTTQEILSDLVQDVYVKLLDFDRQALRNFQGESDNSFLAYLSKIANNIVAEYFRKQLAEKRRGNEISIQFLIDEQECQQTGSKAITHTYLSINGETKLLNTLATQEISKVVEEILVGQNSQRDLLVFKLCTIEGMSSKEIAETKEFELKPSSIESIIRRVKDKIRLALKTETILSNAA